MTGEFDATSEDSSGILPIQTPLGARWDGDTSGPRALMLAVLEDALRCIERGRRRRTFYARRLAADAEAWLRSESRDWPFAFLNVCDVLGFQPDAVRNCFSRTRTSSLASIHRSKARPSDSAAPGSGRFIQSSARRVGSA